MLAQWAVLIATACVIGLIVRTYVHSSDNGRYGFGLGFLAYIGSFFVVNTSMNGLETGALLLAYAVVWRFVQLHDLSWGKSIWILGVLLGITALVRIDSLVVSVCILVWLWASYGFKSALKAGVTSTLIVMPWILYGLLLTSSPVPSSGRAQTLIELSLFRLDRIFDAVVSAGFPWIPLSTLLPGSGAVIRAVLIVGLICLFVVLRKATSRSQTTRRTEDFGVALVAGVFALAIYYGTTSYAYWFYGRYLSPLVLISSVVLASCLIWLPRTLTILAGFYFTAIALAASAGHWVNWLYQENTMYTEQVALVEGTVPTNDAVAAGQTGTLGFFRKGVVNLDGKVNAEILDFDGSPSEYLDSKGVIWLCDWPRLIDEYLGADHPGWDEIDEKGEYLCIRRNTSQS